MRIENEIWYLNSFDVLKYEDYPISDLTNLGGSEYIPTPIFELDNYLKTEDGGLICVNKYNYLLHTGSCLDLSTGFISNFLDVEIKYETVDDAGIFTIRGTPPIINNYASQIGLYITGISGVYDFERTVFVGDLQFMPNKGKIYL